MNTDKLQLMRSNYSNALKRLEEVLEADPSNTFVYDAAIQRFEFTYELAWKLLKEYLLYTGIAVVNSPRATFKEAFAVDLIQNGEAWIAMLDDRNLTAHTYDEKKALEIYQRIKSAYYPQFVDLAQKINKAVE
ncbi:MAG: nucleotidyltransferase substrate binding protein [Bacillota bacterium]|nr:nucleotidyltransferase substrate binding protein [Bacillota bacterium]